MRKILFLIGLFVIVFSAESSAQTIKQKVAVYVTGDADDGFKKVIGSKLVTGITRSEKYTAVERTGDFLTELTREQDYQLSGAVRDKEIARLGAQFGVQYVLVADITEVLGTIFISARMIDVQTAEITNSTEADGVVNSMDGLSSLAENIILGIMGVQQVPSEDVKFVSVFNFENLYNIVIPEGYHIATSDEVNKIIENFLLTGKKISLPIYADIKKNYRSSKRDFQKKQKSGWVNDYRHLYHFSVSGWFFENAETCNAIELEKVEDPSYSSYINYETIGCYNQNFIPTITPGYVYFVKNK